MIEEVYEREPDEATKGVQKNDYASWISVKILVKHLSMHDTNFRIFGQDLILFLNYAHSCRVTVADILILCEYHCAESFPKMHQKTIST